MQPKERNMPSSQMRSQFVLSQSFLWTNREALPKADKAKYPKRAWKAAVDFLQVLQKAQVSEEQIRVRAKPSGPALPAPPPP